MKDPKSFLKIIEREKKATGMEPKLPLLFRIQLRADKIRLAHYKRQAEKIYDLQYKIENPTGWLADQIVEEASKFMTDLNEVLEKASTTKVSTRKIEKLVNYQQALLAIVVAQMGTRHVEATQLLSDFVPKLLQYCNDMNQVLIPQECESK